eukprot:754278-Hanusia_phi.AAC.2
MNADTTSSQKNRQRERAESSRSESPHRLNQLRNNLCSFHHCRKLASCVPLSLPLVTSSNPTCPHQICLQVLIGTAGLLV